MVAMMKPRESWVARYQRVVKCVPGIYAIQVSGGEQEGTATRGEDEDEDYRDIEVEEEDEEDEDEDE
jgi:transcription elongation factor SPT4